MLAYGSRALKDVETRYSQTEREMLAVVWAAEHYHLYVFGTHFRIFTDHKPLLRIFEKQNPLSARMEIIGDFASCLMITVLYTDLAQTILQTFLVDIQVEELHVTHQLKLT